MQQPEIDFQGDAQFEDFLRRVGGEMLRQIEEQTDVEVELAKFYRRAGLSS